MITLNVREILSREEARKAAEEAGEVRESGTRVQENQPPPDPEPSPNMADDEKAVILKELWAEFGHIKRQRGKLSSRSAHLVRELEEKIAAESPTLLEIFRNGQYHAQEIKDHYAQIQAWSDKAIVVYDQIQYVEQYGKLPVVVHATPTEEDLAEENAIKHELRRLDDLIYKTNKKIQEVSLNGKKSSRTAEWKEKVALAEARREDLRQKLKRKQHEARERTNAE